MRFTAFFRLWVILIIWAPPAAAGGALKITQVRTDSSYGDNTFLVFPNGRPMVIDGGASSANSNNLTAFLDSVVGAGGTIWYMALSHGHSDHYSGLQSALNGYVVMRYYSSFPENDTTAESLAAGYGTFTGLLNTEFSTPYTTNANCYEIVATANPATTPKVSGPNTNLGPGWDTTIDALVISGEEMSTNTNPNNNSVSYHIWYGSSTSESGGDMTETEEPTAVTNYGGAGGRINRNVQLLKMHHHGSNTSNSAGWLDEIQPVNPLRRYAYACTGDVAAATNLRLAAVERVAGHGHSLYRTDLDGRTRFAATGDGNWSTIRQYVYSEGGTTTNHDASYAPPNPPGSPAAAASGSSVNLSWSAPASALTLNVYFLYRATVPGGVDIPLVSGEDPAAANWRTGSVSGLYQRIAQVAAPGTTHQDVGLTGGTYYYRLKASNTEYYESEYSGEVSVSMGADTTPPATPTGLGVADVAAEGNSLRLSWTANTEGDLKDYGVYRSTAPAQAATASTRRTFITAPGTTHYDSGLTDNTTYYYRLTARDTSSNESGATADASAYPLPAGDITPPAVPTGLGVADVPGDQGTALNLSWTANTEADLKNYGVYRATFSGALSTKALRTFITAPGTTHQDASAVPGTTYYYQTTARDTSLNESGGATEVSAYPVDNLTPAAPTGLGVADIVAESASMKMSWTANTESDLKDYRIYRSTNVGVTLVSSHVVTAILSPGTTHRDAGLVNGATYYYRLTARDTSLNESGLSAEVSAFPVAASAASIVISEVWGWETATNEWVELYNPTDSSISIGGWMIGTNTSNTDAVLVGTATIAARSYFKIGDTGSGGLPNDQDATITITNTNSYVQLRDATSTTIDVVAWGLGTNMPAGTTAYGVSGDLTTGAKGLLRKPGNSSGRGTDTDNCANDFTLVTTSIPRNSTSAAEPDVVAPAVPTGVAVADVPSDQGGALRLNWTANTESDLKDYGVYRALASGALGSKSPVTRIASGGTTHQDGGLANGTTYYYQMTARDTTLNESAGSAEVSAYPLDNLAPAVPGAPAVADVPSDEGTALRLNWAANTEGDLKDYRIYRSTNAGVTQVSSHVVTAIAAPGTTHQDRGLVPGTTYYDRLSARDTNANESGLSGEASAYPVDNTPPAAPLGLSVGDPGTTVLTLAWEANGESDLKDYRVYRSTNAGVTLVSSHVVTAILSPGTTHQDAGLTAGRRYNYQLTARDTSLNESGAASEVSGVPGAPATPTGPAVSNTLGGASAGYRLTLTWTANTEADRKDYRVYRSTNLGVTQVSSHVITAVVDPGTTHQDGGLANGTTLYYRLTARDTSLNESGLSSEVSGYPADIVPPAAPTGLGIADVAWDSGTALSVSWTANTEADLKDYGVYRATFGGVLGTKGLATRIAAPGTTHQDVALARGATYYYQMTARDVSTNESGGGTEASALTVDNWLREPVDTSVANVGRRVQVAADRTGAIHLAYYSNTDSALKYAKKSGGSWTLETVETGISDGAGFGAFVGLAVNTAGTPYIIYSSSGAGLKFAQKPAASWTTSTVESGDLGYECSLALDGAGNLHAAYRSGSALKYGKWNGTSWSTATVDTAGGAYTGITVQAGGQVHISYNVATNVLKHARSTDNGSTWDLVETLDSTTGSWNDETAIAVADSGTIHIGYYDTGPFDLAYAQYNGAAWSTGTLESAGTVGDYPDITLDASGNPLLSYLQVTNGETKLARWTGSAWERTVVSTAGAGAGDFTGLEFTPDGVVHVLYRAGSQLWHAQSVPTLSAPALVQQPSGLYTSTWSATSITWNWSDNATNETGYRVRTSTHLSVSGNLAANVVSYAESGLTPNTTYTRYAQVFNSGEVGNSTTSTRVTLANAPSGTAVSSVSSTTATLTWALNGNPSGTWFQAQRSTFDGGYAAIVSTAGSPYADTGLLGASTYYYRLRARNWEDQFTAFDSTVSAVTNPDSTPPGAPTGLGLTDPGTSALNLSWTANTEPDLRDYRVYRSTNAGVTFVSSHVVTAILTPGTTHQDGGLTTGRQYFYRLASRDRSLNETGGAGEVSGVPGAPAAPTGLSLVDPGTTVLNLAWTANTEPDVKDYVVYRSTNIGVTQVSSNSIAAVASPGTTNQNGDVVLGTRYNYRISARDVSSNQSGLSAEVFGVPGAPAAPTGLGVADVPGDQGFALRLSWGANTEADLKDYRIRRTTFVGVGMADPVVATIASPGTTHQDGSLGNGTTYYYRLSARDTSLNESGLSAEPSSIPYDNLAPAAPGGFSASGSTNAVKLSWTTNTEADLKDYRVWRSTNSGVTLVSSHTVRTVLAPGTTHQDDGLTNGTTYYYRLTARDASQNESPGSSEISALPQMGADTIPPAAPAGLGAADVPLDQGFALQLSWTANAESDLKDYRVYRTTSTSGVTVGSTWTALVTNILAPGTTHLDGALTNGTTFYYRLTARDTNSNESAASAQASAIPYDNTAPAAPAGMGAADVPTDQGFALRLSWGANTEADLKDYRIRRTTFVGVGIADPVVATIASPGTTHQDGGLTNGTTFYYRLAARDTSANESGLSAEASSIPYDNLAPAAPTGPGVSNTVAGANAGGRLTLSWTANTEADLKDYGVYRATWAGASPAPTPTRITAAGTTHQDAGLTNGTTFYYRLTARDASLNESGYSSEVSVYPADVVAPGAPVGLGVANALIGGALNTSWTANTESDLKDYKIFRGLSSGGIGTKSLMTAVLAPGTTHRDSGLANGTTYYYQVTARDLTGNESGGSLEANGMPTDTTPPAAPTGVGVADVAGDQGFALRLSWAANTESDLKDYGVYRATTAGGVDAAPTRILTPGTTHQAAGLTNGATQYFRLTARDAGLNESGYSTEVSAYPIDNLAPATPVGVGVTNPGFGFRLNLSWTANTESDLKDYGVYQATWTGASPAPAPARIAAPGTTHQAAGLTNGATYYFRLTARDVSLNESGFSTEVSAVPADTPPAAPTALGAADAGTGSRLNLSWAANAEADLKDYRVSRSTNGNVTAGSSWTVIAATVAAPGTTHQDAGLVDGSTYYYRLSARDIGLNESPLSNLVSAVPVAVVVAPPAPPAVTPPPPSPPPTVAVTVSVTVSAPTGGTAELKTALEPGKATRIDGDTLTLKSAGAAPGDIIEVRIVNTKTSVTLTVSVMVDAQGNWAIATPKLSDGTYLVQVRQVDPNPNGQASPWAPDKPFVVTVDAVPDQTVTIPAGPNPFTPGRGVTMAAGFELQTAANVTVSIHTADGALVKTLVDGRALGPGKYERGPAGDAATGWDGTNESGQVVSSGIYLLKIKIGDRTYSRKVILIR